MLEGKMTACGSLEMTTSREVGASGGVKVEGSKYVWLGSMFRGAGVADESKLSLPLSTNPLSHLLINLQEVNFLPCVGIYCS